MFKKFYLIIIVFWSFPAFSQNCYNHLLNDGKSIRLDQNGLLKNFKTQDQDGLETCYANTSSLLFHSVVGATPSYLMLGRKHGQSKTSNAADFIKNATQNKIELAINRGHVCATVDAEISRQKQGQHVCLQNATYLEKGAVEEGDSTFKQAEMLSAYLEWNRLIESAEKKLTPSMSTIRALVNSSRAESKIKCSQINPDFLAHKLYLAFSAIVDQHPECWKNGSAVIDSENSMCIAIKSAVESVFEKSEFVTLRGRRELSLPNNQIVFSKKSFSPYVSPENQIINFDPTQSKDFFVNLALSDSFKDSRHMHVKDQNKIKKIKNDLKQLEMESPQVADFMRIIAEQKSGQSNQECENFYILKNSLKKIEETKNGNSDICKLFGSMIKTSFFKEKNFEMILQAVLNLNSKELFKNIGLDCEEADRFKASTDVKCNEVSFVEENKNYTASYVTKIQSEHRSKVIESLSKGRSVGYSFCTDILNSSAKYLITENRDQVMCREANGRHSVGVVGAKCEKGKLSFLMQNSWGTRWKPNNPDLKSETNGKFWMNESDFFNNIIGLSYMD